MIVDAEFEEKEYEVAATGELHSGGYVRSPGQLLEAIVAYDVAAHPHAQHVVWQLLQVQRPPGVTLVPRNWSAPHPEPDRLPAYPVSLLVQYKRPTYVDSRRASQWSYWGRPYYRFSKFQAAQDARLLRLQRSLGRKAVVRYCAPAFWRTAELEAATVTRQTLQLSGFVAPTKLARHRYWTYTDPGVAGYANPDRRSARFESIWELEVASGELGDLPLPRGTESGPLFRHLAEIARTCRTADPTVQRGVDAWLEGVRQRRLPISADGLARLRDLAAASSVISRANAEWFVGALELGWLPRESARVW